MKACGCPSCRGHRGAPPKSRAARRDAKADEAAAEREAIASWMEYEANRLSGVAIAIVRGVAYDVRAERHASFRRKKRA